MDDGPTPRLYAWTSCDLAILRGSEFGYDDDSVDTLRSRSTTLKAALAYALVNGGPAAWAPFAALWLRARGAPLSDVGILLAVPLIGRVFAAYPLATWAARFSKPWVPISLLCAVAALGAVFATLDQGVWSSVIAWWTVCFCAGACTPLLDTRLVGAGDGLLAYARGAAALARIGANLGVGYLFARLGTAGVPLWAGSTAVLAAAAMAKLMPKGESFESDARACPSERSVEKSERSDGLLVLAVLAAALIQASHGFNSIAMVIWSENGYGPTLSGALWATGILADVGFLWFMGGMGNRISPTHLLILGGLGALIRWNGFALAPSLAVLFGLQTLHALSFTATYLASVQLVARLARDKHALVAQAMNWAVSSGLCAGLGTLGVGPLYAALGVHGYWVMCALAGIGVVFAVALNSLMQRRLVCLSAEGIESEDLCAAPALAVSRRGP